jgi:hypothetical protein
MLHSWLVEVVQSDREGRGRTKNPSPAATPPKIPSTSSQLSRCTAVHAWPLLLSFARRDDFSVGEARCMARNARMRAEREFISDNDSSSSAEA